MMKLCRRIAASTIYIRSDLGQVVSGLPDPGDPLSEGALDCDLANGICHNVYSFSDALLSANSCSPGRKASAATSTKPVSRAEPSRAIVSLPPQLVSHHWRMLV
mmetsp:Transcript_11220/g.23709  ORF Transcript_11220/g.23709 Transcript_11220/m.23709 type:complete len:104 (+) Transcript_11220:371-682(+)